MKQEEFNFDGEDEARASKGDYGNALKNKEEFVLSEKEITPENLEIRNENVIIPRGLYKGEDVKEFIRREDKLIELYQTKQISFEEFLDKRSKLAGDKLK